MNVELRKKNRRHNKDLKVSKYLKKLITRILLSIILFLIVAITNKIDNQKKLLIDKYLFEDSFQFTKINKIYKNFFGNLLPKSINKDILVFNKDDVKNKNHEKYKNAEKIFVSKSYPVSAYTGGIVVFIGNKNDYGNTVIIQGNDGIDYWYSGLMNISINLYDYIETNTLIGETEKDYFYILLEENNQFLDYDEYF